MPGRKLFVSGLPFAVAVVLRVQAQATFTDSFATPVNYLTNGVARTIWNGIYFGAGEFANTGLASTSTGVTVAGSTSDCDADISANSVLTVTSTGTGWEGTEDDGFFLFQEIAGDFSVRVHIVTPFDNGQYNTAGLQVRAAGPNGNPYGGAENFVSWTRFNEFGFGNYLRNEVNGTVTEINPNPGSGPGQGVNDTNYWLRIDRVGNTFNYYSAEYGPISNDWVQVPPGTAAGAASRPDWAGLPLQVGIMHATFEGTPATHTAHFEQFSLSASNLTMTAAPAPVTDLTLTTNEDGSLTLSWIPGAGSTGSLVVAWTGTNSVVKEVPADGITYSGNSAYGQGDTLPATNYYVVYSGPGNSMTLSNLAAGTIYNVAVFSYAGSGSSLTYNHTPATALAAPSLRIQARLQGMDVLVTANADPGKWYWLQYSDSLNPPDWTYVGPVAQLATNPTMMLVHSNGASASQRFYRLLQFDSLPAGRNLAPFAAPMTSYVSPWETLSAIDDGYMPTNSADYSHGAYGNYPQTGTQWVEYDWPLPITTSRMDVYWWQDNVGIYAPASCSLQYWNGNGFVPVSNPSGLGVALDQFNTTTFDPVTTTRLRLLFQSDASGHSTGILEWRVYDAGGSPATWPAPPTNSEFLVKLGAGAIESLQRAGDSFPTEYVATSERLGDAIIKYEPSGGNNWNVVQTADSTGVASTSYSTSPDGTEYMTTYLITNSLSGSLILQTIFTFQQDAVHWTLNFTNLTSQPLMIGDLALPLPMNTSFSGVSSSVLKHSFISGYDSYLFWMRPNSVGPELLMTPDDNTKLEYWDTLGPGSETFFLETLGGFEAYIHSYVASTNAAAQYPSVITQGDRWRQPNTSLTLAPGASQTYGFKFQWADGYDDIRQKLVDDGKVDVHIVPGMTVPTNLFAEIALNTTQTVSSVDAEFPAQTQIQFLGTTNVGAGNYQLYQVQFSRLGENELTIHYGNSRTMYLEFFVTEPVETLIKKRAAFIASHQVIDTNKWYNGLLCEWNMNDEVMLTPDNYDTLSGFVVYEVASDDPGESRPAYLATKEAVFPVQSEVSALDYYITNFVWGGLQRTTNETDSYGIYGTPDWHTLRTNNNLSLGRGYDYPHIVVMYYGMYQVAKHHPEITTALSAQEYLRRAWGTAVALYTVAGGAQANQIGLMNEMITPEVINSLQAEGMTNEAVTLQGYWEQKVNYFVTGNPNLFGSEFAFDSTGFETQEALASYAVQHAGSDLLMGSTNSALFLQQARQFMSDEITANVFDRGWLESAYYYYGSDYRALAGDSWVLTYMSQMGGWSLLDYALNFATNSTDYLRLGYASILSAWATMNSGTPASNYGFWYPGAANDGGAGGGFEPSAYNTTWLEQAMHRGDWYYCAEGNLGFCGAVRSAATILADDPIFGRFCYGGTWQQTTNIQVVPLDGVRRRFHAMFDTGYLHLVLDNDRFAAAQPIVLQPDLSQVSFQIESENTAAHSVTLHFTSSTAATYTFSSIHGAITTTNLPAGQEAVVSLPKDAGSSPQSFNISR